MHGKHRARDTLPGEKPVHLVNQLPAVQVQRLGHGARLEGARADAQERGIAAVARREHAHGVVWQSCLRQNRRGVVEIDVVDRQRVRPTLPIARQQVACRRGHQFGAARDRDVPHLEQGAAGAAAHHGRHRIRLGLGQCVVVVAEDDDTRVPAGLHDGRQRRDACHLERIRGHVHGHGRAGYRSGLGRDMPADDRNTPLGEWLQPGQQRMRVAAEDDQAVGTTVQRIGEHLLAAFLRATGVEDLHAPANDPGRLEHAFVRSQDAAIAQILVHQGDAFAGLGARAAARPGPTRGGLRSGVDDALRVGQVVPGGGGRGDRGCAGPRCSRKILRRGARLHADEGP